MQVWKVLFRVAKIILKVIFVAFFYSLIYIYVFLTKLYFVKKDHIWNRNLYKENGVSIDIWIFPIHSNFQFYVVATTSKFKALSSDKYCNIVPICILKGVSDKCILTTLKICKISHCSYHQILCKIWTRYSAVVE